jgi:hypothetical protein
VRERHDHGLVGLVLVILEDRHRDRLLADVAGRPRHDDRRAVVVGRGRRSVSERDRAAHLAVAAEPLDRDLQERVSLLVFAEVERREREDALVVAVSASAAFEKGRGEDEGEDERGAD